MTKDRMFTKEEVLIILEHFRTKVENDYWYEPSPPETQVNQLMASYGKTKYYTEGPLRTFERYLDICGHTANACPDIMDACHWVGMTLDRAQDTIENVLDIALANPALPIDSAIDRVTATSDLQTCFSAKMVDIACDGLTDAQKATLKTAIEQCSDYIAPLEIE